MRHLGKLLVFAISFGVPSAQEAEPEVALEPTSEWTVLLYGAVDNDWERPFMRDIRGMLRGLKGADGVEVVLLIDRSPEYSRDDETLGEDFDDTRLYRLTGGEVERVSGEPQIPGVTLDSKHELNTGAASTLRDFIRFGKQRYPARHYALWLVSHGEGPQSCPDETDEDLLFTAELTEVLTEADSVDIIGFDACLMAGVENAYQWRRRPGAFGADFLLAAAPVSSSWPYEEIFGRLGSQANAVEASTGVPAPLDARAFAAAVVDELRSQITDGRSGDRGLERDLQSWGSFDLALVGDAKQRLDALAQRLWQDDAKEQLVNLRGAGLEAGTYVYVWPERNADLSMPNVDLTHMCERIAAEASFSPEARALAKSAAEAAAAVVSHSFGLDHYSGFQDGRHGLYLVFPDGDKQTKRGKTYWERTDWYTPLRVEGDRDSYGLYEWCIDGAQPANQKVDNWFELMDAWFDTSTGDAPGGVNNYAW